MANRFVLNETSYHGKGAIKEIAAEMDISESKVKMTLLRCRNELKKALEKEGVPV